MAAATRTNNVRNTYASLLIASGPYHGSVGPTQCPKQGEDDRVKKRDGKHRDRAHFAHGYRLRANGSTPAPTNRRITTYWRALIRRSSGTRALYQDVSPGSRPHSNDHCYPTVGARLPKLVPKVGPV